MDGEVEAFIARWMNEHAGLFEEMLYLLGENPATPYGAAMQAYLQSAEQWELRPQRRSIG